MPDGVHYVIAQIFIRDGERGGGLANKAGEMVDEWQTIVESQTRTQPGWQRSPILSDYAG